MKLIGKFSNWPNFAKLSLVKMISRDLFDLGYMSEIRGEELSKARSNLIASLSTFLSLELIFVPDDSSEDLWRTGIEGSFGSGPYAINWHGFIGASDHRRDGTVEYCAYLFPVIDLVRVFAMDSKASGVDFAFRYLSMPDNKKWVDHGWGCDEYNEFDGWYSGGMGGRQLR